MYGIMYNSTFYLSRSRDHVVTFANRYINDNHSHIGVKAVRLDDGMHWLHGLPGPGAPVGKHWSLMIQPPVTVFTFSQW